MSSWKQVLNTRIREHSESVHEKLTRLSAEQQLAEAEADRQKQLAAVETEAIRPLQIAVASAMRADAKEAAKTFLQEGVGNLTTFYMDGGYKPTPETITQRALLKMRGKESRSKQVDGWIVKEVGTIQSGFDSKDSDSWHSFGRQTRLFIGLGVDGALYRIDDENNWLKCYGLVSDEQLLKLGHLETDADLQMEQQPVVMAFRDTLLEIVSH